MLNKEQLDAFSTIVRTITALDQKQKEEGRLDENETFLKQIRVCVDPVTFTDFSYLIQEAEFIDFDMTRTD